MRGLSVPTTTRSGFMKSSIAAPSLRNSGFETTSNSMFAPRALSVSSIRARTLSPVPTGTVDLVTTTRVLGHVLADRRGDRQHIFQIGRAVLVGRRADRDELEQAVLHAFGRVGRELDAAGREVLLDQRIETRLVDRRLAALEPLDLALVDVDAQHVVAGLGKARAGDQAHVTRTEYGDSHV